MTADEPSLIATDDHRDTAVELLNNELELLDLEVDKDGQLSPDHGLRRVLAALVCAQLDANDLTRQQANAQAQLLGEMLAEFRALAAAQLAPAGVVPPADFIIDHTDDVWTHTGNGLYESKQDSGLYDVPAKQIRQQWSPVKEFWQHPPTSAPVAPKWPDLVILGDHGQWRHVGTGEYAFEGIDNLAPLTLAELRRSGPTREYALLPHTPITAQEADPS